MIFENLHVKHKSFGDGTVISTNGSYITVKFDIGNKTFVYPDIFERFLTLDDGTVSDEILTDLNKSKSDKQKILDQKKAENVRAMTRGIVIPGKEMSGTETEEEENRLKSNELEDL